VGSWIKRSRSGNISGPFGLLENWMAKKTSNFSKGVQLLQIYTSLKAKRVTPQQLKKFVTAVTAMPPKQDVVSKYKKTVLLGAEIADLKPRTPHWKFPLLMDYCSSSSRRAPIPGGKTVTERDGIIDSIGFILLAQDIPNYVEFASIYDAVLGEGLSTKLNQNFENYQNAHMDIMDLPFVVGHIGLIQEPGYKLRAVANPARIFQSALKPLQKSLLALVDSLPWDCTHDQAKGFPWIQKFLSCGKKGFSVDLSNATDYFPLSLQECLLRYLYKEDRSPIDNRSLVDLFSKISRAEWIMPGYGNISWRRGQPLGLAPSFPAFALTHGLLLLGLLGHPYDHEFFVLGDDVVILDSDLYAKYLQAMEELGCPVSMPKTLQSNWAAEFGGKLILKDKIIPQYKYRDVSDNSFLDIARCVGPTGLRMFKSNQRLVIKALSEVPEIFNGLGWNPKGKPFDQRLSDWMFDETYHPLDRETSLSKERLHRLMNSSLWQSIEPYCRTDDDDITKHDPRPADALDQRARRLVLKYLPSLLNWVEISGKNLDVIFHDLAKDLDLPLKTDGRELASQTTLQVWMRKLTLHK
jgi:hypothetical protein